MNSVVLFKNSQYRAETETEEEKTEKLREQLNRADALVIGAGAGLSTAAGLTYSGSRFTEQFSDFIETYNMTDMYSAGFYPFETQEEKWAYWSRHIYCNRYDVAAGDVYRSLYRLIKDKNYFVLTTNVDHQFQKAGFSEKALFATQGDYGLFQCARACHDVLYDNEQQVREMVSRQENCRIPEDLIPKCPVCGGLMEVNLRKDSYFVEDRAWHQAARRYEKFLKRNMGKKILFLELGVGMNTPGIIKYPFWEMTAENPRATYACVNLGEACAPTEIGDRTICINADIGKVLEQL